MAKKYKSGLVKIEDGYLCGARIYDLAGKILGKCGEPAIHLQDRGELKPTCRCGRHYLEMITNHNKKNQERVTVNKSLNNQVHQNRMISVARHKNQTNTIAEYRGFTILSKINPTSSLAVFCEQEARFTFLYDCTDFGLNVINEYPLIRKDSVRLRECIDLYIPMLSLFIEAKNTEKTFSKKATAKQVNLYKDLYIHSKQWKKDLSISDDFVSYAIDGSNAEMNMKEIYVFVLNRLNYFKNDLGVKFPNLNYKGLVARFKARIKALEEVEYLMKNSIHYDEDRIKNDLGIK